MKKIYILKNKLNWSLTMKQEYCPTFQVFIHVFVKIKILITK